MIIFNCIYKFLQAVIKAFLILINHEKHFLGVIICLLSRDSKLLCFYLDGGMESAEVRLIFFLRSSKQVNVAPAEDDG
jgi:hypothetical protein